MSGDAPISWLMFFTLSAGIAVGAALFLGFLRSRRNREIAAYALEGDGRSQRLEPSGAGTEPPPGPPDMQPDDRPAPGAAPRRAVAE